MHDLPKYPATHPSEQSPSGEQTWLKQFMLHPKKKKSLCKYLLLLLLALIVLFFLHFAFQVLQKKIVRIEFNSYPSYIGKT